MISPIRILTRGLALACLVSTAWSQIPSSITLNAVFGSAGSGAFGRLAGMEELPGKPGHFLVAEFSGKIWLLTPSGTSHARTLFATIPVVAGDDERGLNPLTFHPDFAVNRKYYVYRGDPALAPRGLRLEEYQASTDFTKDSGRPPRSILTISMPPEFNDHNGGGILFGRDGYLYLGVGDGGWDLKTPDVHNNGQNRKVLSGKIIRIDVDRKDPGLEYSIPADNPFRNDPDPAVRREIYAYGLRNPYRMSMDRVTGDIYVADVGLFNFEKVLILKKGANYGWKLQEHTLCYTPGTCAGITVEPSAAWMTYGPVKCFIGGHVYRGDPASPFYGVYLFGDHTMKRLLAFKKGTEPVQATNLTSTPTEMTGFTIDSQNNLYMVGYYGTVYKLNHPDLRSQPTSIRGIPDRARLRAGVWKGGRGMSGGIYALDGSRVGTVGHDGLPREGTTLPEGLFLNLPDAP